MDLETADALSGQGAAAPDANVAPEVTSSAPSTEAVQENVAQPPAESKSAQPKPEENKIPYERFKEKVDEVNQYKTEALQLKNSLKELEAKMEERLPALPQPENPLIASVVKDLVSEGLEETAARALAKSVVKLAENQVQPIKHELETDRWINNFAEKHKDFDEIKDKMSEVYGALPKNAQMAVASDPVMLELLYSHVKFQNYEQEIEKAKKEGATSAYENKQIKAGVTSAPTAAALPENYDISSINQKIGEMSLEDYRVNRDKILKSLYGSTPPKR